jgi:hypothetical protein
MQDSDRDEMQDAGFRKRDADAGFRMRDTGYGIVDQG